MIESHIEEAKIATANAQWMKRHEDFMDLVDDFETRKEGLKLIDDAYNLRGTIYRVMRKLNKDTQLIHELQLKGDPLGLVPDKIAAAVQLQEQVIVHCYNVWRLHKKFDEFKVLNDIPEPRDKRYKEAVPESPEPEE